jgi:hypothetical protein
MVNLDDISRTKKKIKCQRNFGKHKKNKIISVPKSSTDDGGERKKESE